jgi:hypothetical protein
MNENSKSVERSAFRVMRYAFRVPRSALGVRR